MWFYGLMISKWGPLAGSAAIGLVFVLARAWVVWTARQDGRKRLPVRMPETQAGRNGNENGELQRIARLRYEQIGKQLVDQLKCAGSKFNHILAAPNSPSHDAGIAVIQINGVRCFRVDCPDDIRSFDQLREEVEAASEFFHAVSSMQFWVLGSTSPGIVLAELRIEAPSADQQNSISFGDEWKKEIAAYYGVDMDKGIRKPINFMQDYLQ